MVQTIQSLLLLEMLLPSHLRLSTYLIFLNNVTVSSIQQLICSLSSVVTKIRVDGFSQTWISVLLLFYSILPFSKSELYFKRKMFTVGRGVWCWKSLNVRISRVKRSVFVVHHTVLFVQSPAGAIELSYSVIQRARPTSVTFMDHLEVMCSFDLPLHYEENHLNKQAAVTLLH